VKSGTLCLFKTEEQFNPLLGISLTKERFRNGDFFNEDWVMIAQQEETSSRCDILFEIMEDNLLVKCSMKEFHSTHKNSLAMVNQINEKHKLSLSWFEILQLAAISEYNKNLEEAFILQASKHLCKFYNQVIKTYDF
jgi:hypothetical protein